MNGIFSSGTRLEIRQNIFALYVLFAVGGRVQSRSLYLWKNIGQFIRIEGNVGNGVGNDYRCQRSFVCHDHRVYSSLS